MTYEHPIHDGFVVQHYGAHDWFPVVDAGWWVREWLMCDEECRAEVEVGDDVAEWGEVVEMLKALGNVGPYREGPVFGELTYNHENDLDNELLVAAGWVDVGKYALHRGPGTPLLRAIKGQFPEHDWDEIGRVYVVAIAYGGHYGWKDATADVYVAPNIDDDYDVARWQCAMFARDSATGTMQAVWDACGGWGDAIDGMEDVGSYPYGSRRECPPMYDVGELTGDRDDDELPDVITGTWLACGPAGVYAIGADGRVHAVDASVS